MVGIAITYDDCCDGDSHLRDGYMIFDQVNSLYIALNHAALQSIRSN